MSNGNEEDTGDLLASKRWAHARSGPESHGGGEPRCAFSLSLASISPPPVASTLLSPPAGLSASRTTWQNVTPVPYGLVPTICTEMIPFSGFQVQSPREGF